MPYKMKDASAFSALYRNKYAVPYALPRLHLLVLGGLLSALFRVSSCFVLGCLISSLLPKVKGLVSTICTSMS